MTLDWTRPLHAMPGDLTAWEWSQVLDVDPATIDAHCEAHGLALRPEQHTTLAQRVRVLEAMLDAMWPEASLSRVEVSR